MSTPTHSDDAAAFIGRWAGAQYVKGSHADGRPHFEAPVPHTVEISENALGIFLGTPFGPIPLYVLGPTAAIIQAVDLAGSSATGRPVVFRVSGGGAHRIGDVIAFTCGGAVEHENGDRLTLFFVFQGERAAEPKPVDPAELH